MSERRLTMAETHRELLNIRKKHGKLTPRLVVQEARMPNHPLHQRFEWDDEKAGDAYRRHQAAELIRSVKVVYKQGPDGEDRKIRAFSTLPTIVGYRPTEEVVKSDFGRQLLLRELERDIKTLQRKYGHLAEFADMVRGVIRPEDEAAG